MTLLKAGVGGVIVETEAYHQDEAASHCHRGRTPRNASMFLAGGHLYVYRIHQSFCCNIVSGKRGEGAGVLLRAMHPTDERSIIASRRKGHPERSWTDGPGKLCQALAIDLEDDGYDLRQGGSALQLLDRGLRYTEEQVEVGPRVGISKAKQLPWRFRLRTQ